MSVLKEYKPYFIARTGKKKMSKLFNFFPKYKNDYYKFIEPFTGSYYVPFWINYFFPDYVKKHDKITKHIYLNDKSDIIYYIYEVFTDEKLRKELIELFASKYNNFIYIKRIPLIIYLINKQNDILENILYNLNNNNNKELIDLFINLDVISEKLNNLLNDLKIDIDANLKVLIVFLYILFNHYTIFTEENINKYKFDNGLFSKSKITIDALNKFTNDFYNFIKQTQVYNLDALSFLNKFDYNGKDVIVFCDPPYKTATNRIYYENNLNLDELHKRLNYRYNKSKIIITDYVSKYSLKYIKEYNYYVYLFDINKNNMVVKLRKDKKLEVVLTNYSPNECFNKEIAKKYLIYDPVKNNFNNIFDKFLQS